MTRRRRALLLTGLALMLGALAASDVASREAELRRAVGGAVPVVVARAPVGRGDPILRSALAVRRVPERFAPSGAFPSPAGVAGVRAAVDISEGTDLTPALLERSGGGPPGPPLRPGERIAELVAVGSPDLVVEGGRVDVLVTHEGRPGARGRTTLALEDVEVLQAAPAAAAGAAGEEPAGARVAASLRVTLRQAVFLAAAQSFARELRLLPRGPGDRRRGLAGLALDGGR